jgi:hypothetical protein
VPAHLLRQRRDVGSKRRRLVRHYSSLSRLPGGARLVCSQPGSCLLE